MKTHPSLAGGCDRLAGRVCQNPIRAWPLKTANCYAAARGAPVRARRPQATRPAKAATTSNPVLA
jgi:hypothetical protein